MVYAARTTVDQHTTRADIEKLLAKAGATAFVYGSEQAKATLMFKLRDRFIRFTLPLPEIGDRAVDRLRAEQGVRSRWRALFLVIKAKLESVDSGIVTFEDEFLSNTITPSGETVSQWLQPQLKIAYERGTMPPLLLGGPTS